MYFESILHPVGRTGFIQEYWGKNYLRLANNRGRFNDLMNWSDLSTILETHNLSTPQLKLVKRGSVISESRYKSNVPGVQDIIRPAAVASALSAGATLVLNNVEELSTKVSELACEFSEVLNTATSVNLYAGFRVEPGLNLHWDSQETVILQLDGRKHWKVFRPTRLHPLRPDLEPAPEPTGAPEWEGMLEPGDVLYMPRGWWHVANPLDEPSLHITVTMEPASGLRFLHWLVDRLRKHPDVRMSFPSLALEEDQLRHLEVLRELLAIEDSKTLLEEFRSELDAGARIRQPFNLPQCVLAQRTPIEETSMIRLAIGRRLGLRPAETEGKVIVWANEMQWQCSESIAPALKKLSDRRATSLGELCEQLDDPRHRQTLNAFLAVLSLAGAVRRD